MFSEDYQLVDFGQGRKLERFGPYLVDRPCPIALRQQRAPRALWMRADGRYEGQPGGGDGWTPPVRLPRVWTIRHRSWSFELAASPSGHLGVFPEQAENWDWLLERLQGSSAAGTEVGSRRSEVGGRRSEVGGKVLNLFAYTGGATMAAASAGAEVVHVDAAKNVVARARRNAQRSGLSDAPIRWICDDARTFVRRELRRGARYDAVILDPPSYGHGPKGQVWKIQRHLESLLADCAELTSDRRRLLLLTCHTTTFTPADLRQLLARTCVPDARQIETLPLTLCSASGRRLPSGLAARWAG